MTLHLPSTYQVWQKEQHHDVEANSLNHLDMRHKQVALDSVIQKLKI
jgi:hypothetical protein